MIMGGHSVKDVVFTDNYPLTQSVTNTLEALRELYHHLETFNATSEPQKLVDGLRSFNLAPSKKLENLALCDHTYLIESCE